MSIKEYQKLISFAKPDFSIKIPKIEVFWWIKTNIL
jgi:hypothetical protein